MELVFGMRRTFVAALFATVLILGFTAAPVAGIAASSSNDAATIVEEYNAQVDSAPDVITDRFANERVALIIEGEEDDDVYTAITDEDAHIESLDEGEHDPTIRVITDEETLNDIAEADDPSAEAVDAYHSDDVTVEGIGVTNTVKVEATKAGYAIASSLGFF